MIPPHVRKTKLEGLTPLPVSASIQRMTDPASTMRKLPLTVQVQGGAMRQGEAIGRKGKQLLVRYHIADGSVRERWFGPGRVNHCYLEQDLELLDRYKGKTCPAVVFDEPVAWADGEPAYPKGVADYKGPEFRAYYDARKVYHEAQDAIRKTAESCPKCGQRHFVTYDHDARTFTGRKSLKLEDVKV